MTLLCQSLSNAHFTSNSIIPVVFLWVLPTALCSAIRRSYSAECLLSNPNCSGKSSSFLTVSSCISTSGIPCITLLTSVHPFVFEHFVGYYVFFFSSLFFSLVAMILGWPPFSSIDALFIPHCPRDLVNWLNLVNSSVSETFDFVFICVGHSFHRVREMIDGNDGLCPYQEGKLPAASIEDIYIFIGCGSII